MIVGHIGCTDEPLRDRCRRLQQRLRATHDRSSGDERRCRASPVGFADHGRRRAARTSASISPSCGVTAIQIIAVTVVLAAIALSVAAGLPPVYRSTATILVQEQEIPPDLVRSTITSFADERIQVISQQVMTRAVLLQLVDKYGLYEKYRGRKTNEDLVELMRKDIKLTTVDANMSDRSSGRRVNATIAFELSYDSPYPAQAQKVVDELVSLYLQENVKARQQSVAETTAFLSQEADRLAKQIQEIETNLANFKRRYAGRTPESSAVNMQLAERTESELLRIEREMSMLQDRRLSLEAQLPLIKPNVPIATNPGGEPILGPAERLKSLQAQYSSASAKYGSDHPDIRRMQREIAALKAESGGSEAGGENAGNLRKLEAELAALKERYSEDHPDVQRLKRSITALKGSERSRPKSSFDRRASKSRQSRVHRLGLPTREHAARTPAPRRAEGRSPCQAADLRLTVAADSGDRARVPGLDARLRQRPDPLSRSAGEADAGRGGAGTREGPQGRALRAQRACNAARETGQPEPHAHRAHRPGCLARRRSRSCMAARPPRSVGQRTVRAGSNCAHPDPHGHSLHRDPPGTDGQETADHSGAFCHRGGWDGPARGRVLPFEALVA